MLLARRAAAEPQNGTLLLLGVTNLPVGSVAVLCLTNGTAGHIACVPEAFKEASATGWVHKALSGRGRPAVRDWIGVPEELEPGEAFTFMVRPPSTGRAWRLVFRCQEQQLVVDPVTDTVRHLTDTNAIKTQLRQFRGRRYYVTSPELAQ